MKKTIFAVAMSIVVAACNNKPADAAQQDTPASETKPSPNSNQTVAINRADIYGKWKFDKASLTIKGKNGSVVLNDTIQGGVDDYFIFKEDGTAISHINGQMQGNEQFKFISNNEMVNANSNEKATIKINSLSKEECQLYFNQTKPDGSVTMNMFLKKNNN